MSAARGGQRSWGQRAKNGQGAPGAGGAPPGDACVRQLPIRGAQIACRAVLRPRGPGAAPDRATRRRRAHAPKKPTGGGSLARPHAVIARPARLAAVAWRPMVSMPAVQRGWAPGRRTAPGAAVCGSAAAFRSSGQLAVGPCRLGGRLQAAIDQRMQLNSVVCSLGSAAAEAISNTAGLTLPNHTPSFRKVAPWLQGARAGARLGLAAACRLAWAAAAMCHRLYGTLAQKQRGAQCLCRWQRQLCRLPAAGVQLPANDFR